MQVEAGWRSWPGGMQVDWSGWLRTPRRAQAPFAGVPRCLLPPFDIRSMALFNRDISKYQATMHPRRRMPRGGRGSLTGDRIFSRESSGSRVLEVTRSRICVYVCVYIYIERGKRRDNLFLRGWRLIDSLVGVGGEFGWVDN